MGVWTFNFLHVGFLHIIMNMSFLLQIGGFLESKMGSAGFFLLTLLLILLVGPMQMVQVWALQAVGTLLHFPPLVTWAANWSGVGFSAVLFGYDIIYIHFMDSRGTVDCCGMAVQQWMTPFLYLGALTVLMGASFMGHLAGIIMGYVFMVRQFKWLYRPAVLLDESMSGGCLAGVYRRGDFRMCPQSVWLLDRPVEVFQFVFGSCCCCSGGWVSRMMGGSRGGGEQGEFVDDQVEIREALRGGGDIEMQPSGGMPSFSAQEKPSSDSKSQGDSQDSGENAVQPQGQQGQTAGPAAVGETASLMEASRQSVSESANESRGGVRGENPMEAQTVAESEKDESG
uniref:Peptidase S54 rhomboid domain-containing protein n=1 Tax=Chromera velia CCMP2878 TaxID=1169474 RepID=A0A0G4FXM0_9ALVE|eukprot:Cvel_19251.t1-p1 / transcript=Cvel_19251.t1 / gene=Cvel_19251 / organism=Chromera_velia_CCMP2878 / gene_product=hypothetical protein / transcript_product=hypothetical protein / location=Cvel_scaffold1647:33973-35770(+) / protein_length=340 / sequence_SO=supercontig / SO=protein_coding / is_pseudo=false